MVLILLLGISKGVLFALIGVNLSKILVYASTELYDYWAYFGYGNAMHLSPNLTMTPFEVVSTLFIAVGIIEIIKAVVQYVKDLQ